jgi:demethylmenaquinone methyltransferase / 2-methoxy-6-polyprenyl-1,4-benzoquinol methylase
MASVKPDPKTKKGEDVRGMFSSIAPKYDLLNHLLSFNIDKCWRKKAIDALDPKSGGRYLDVCTGTGDFAFELLKRQGTMAVGVDFSEEMLRYAEAKKNDFTDVFFAAGDAMELPFKEGVFDGAMAAFGIRNFEGLEKGLLSVAKVLKKDSRFVVLEFPHKVGGIFGPLFNFYFRAVLPMLGRMISKDSFAYNYLPESTRHFPDDEALKKLFEKCGFEIVSFKKRTMGIVLEILLISR